jgi:hypothetical protein
VGSVVPKSGAVVTTDPYPMGPAGTCYAHGAATRNAGQVAVPPGWTQRNAIRPTRARRVRRRRGFPLSSGVPAGWPHSPSSLSSNTGLRAVAADMDDMDILFFHLLHGNRGRGCARASPASRARGWLAAGGRAGGASGPAGRARPGGGEPGDAAALLPLRSAPLLISKPGCAPRPQPGAWPAAGKAGSGRQQPAAPAVRPASRSLARSLSSPGPPTRPAAR